MTLDSSYRPTVKELFLAAVDAHDRQQIAQILDASGCDSATRAEVEKLLSAHAVATNNLLDQAVGRLGLSEDITLTESSADLAIGTVVGSFTIRESIGEGGMGTVYAAQQTEPVRRKVALKIIRAAIATNDVIQRFEAERQAIAMMDHPHIAKVLEAGKTSAGQPYLAMELVQGLPITKYADTYRLTTEARLKLFEKVCLAVRHAHRKGIIHRDLKPSNILVAHIDDAAVPKIIDFGLAKAIDRPLTDATVYSGFSKMLGTPMYMSPEQAEMGVIDVDTRSDVYSLGVILYELLSGVPPFDRARLRAGGFDEMRRIVREVEPRRPSYAISTLNTALSETIAKQRGIDVRKLCAALKGELDWIVLKALEKDRERRYGSSGELARDIRRFLENETVEACPPSAMYQLKKYVWRNRWPALVASTIFAALLATSWISVWQFRSVRNANLAIVAREQRTNELLEAMQYREAVEYFRLGNFSALENRLDTWSRTTEPEVNTVLQRPAGMVSLLASAAHIPDLSIQHHDAAIHDLAVSGNGQHAVTVDERGDVYLWDMGNRASKGVKLGSHGEPAHAVAIAPDGQHAVTGSQSGWLKFWDLQEKILLSQDWRIGTGIETLVYSPDGQTIAAGARYSSVWVGDKNGKRQFRIENDHRHEALLFSPDSSELLVPTTDRHIDVWNVETGKRQQTIDTGPLNNVRAMCFAGSNQRWLVVGERFSETLAIIDLQSGKIAGEIIAGSYPRALTASPDGFWMAASYSDGRIQLIQLSDRRDEKVTGEVRYQFQAHLPADEVRLPLQWLDSSFEFVSAGSDGRIMRWSRALVPPMIEIQPPNPLFGSLLQVGRQQPFFFYSDHLRSKLPQLNEDSEEFYFPEGIVADEASHGLLAFARSNKISIVNHASGRELAEIESPFDAHWWVGMSPDGEALIGGDQSGFAVWTTHDSWRTYQLVRLAEIPLKMRPVVTRDHRTVIAHNDDLETIVEIAIDSGKTVAIHPAEASSFCLSHDERFLAIAGQRGIQVISRRTKQFTVMFASNSAPKQLRFFPDDKVLLSVNNDGSIRGWHMATGEPLGALYSPKTPLGPPVFLQITEDGRRVTACYSGPNSRIPVILGRP